MWLVKYSIDGKYWPIAVWSVRALRIFEKKQNEFQNLSPAVFVIGRCSLSQRLLTGGLHSLWCASSAWTEKPEEAIRRPLWTFGSKTFPTRHKGGGYFLSCLKHRSILPAYREPSLLLERGMASCPIPFCFLQQSIASSHLTATM